jgi:hypothetical protein
MPAPDKRSEPPAPVGTPVPKPRPKPALADHYRHQAEELDAQIARQAVLAEGGTPAAKAVAARIRAQANRILERVRALNTWADQVERGETDAAKRLVSGEARGATRRLLNLRQKRASHQVLLDDQARRTQPAPAVEVAQ